RPGGGNVGAAATARLSILILIRAYPLTVGIVAAAVVVIAVVIAVRPGRSGSHRGASGYAAPRTTISRIAVDALTNCCSRYRPSGYWTIPVAAPGNPVSTDTSSVNGTTTEVARAHAAAVEASTTTKAATSTTAGECVIGNQACRDENECSESGECI